jgi:hypothetical protein
MKALAPAELSALAKHLVELETASRIDLVNRWNELYGREPPPNTSRALLTLAIGYKIQEKVRGRLKPSVLRRLFELADGLQRPKSSTAPTRGTVLVRQWQGITHSVTVLEKGVSYQSKVYGSLTEVARLITGTHQSGFVFFGLTKRHD